MRDIKMKHKQPYKKPTIKRVTKMSFPTDIIRASGKGVVCRQCSSCHGCR